MSSGILPVQTEAQFRYFLYAKAMRWRRNWICFVWADGELVAKLYSYRFPYAQAVYDYHKFARKRFPHQRLRLRIVDEETYDFMFKKGMYVVQTPEVKGTWYIIGESPETLRVVENPNGYTAEQRTNYYLVMGPYTSKENAEAVLVDMRGLML